MTHKRHEKNSFIPSVQSYRSMAAVRTSTVYHDRLGCIRMHAPAKCDSCYHAIDYRLPPSLLNGTSRAERWPHELKKKVNSVASSRSTSGRRMDMVSWDTICEPRLLDAVSRAHKLPYDPDDAGFDQASQQDD